MTIVYRERWKPWGLEFGLEEFWKYCRPDAPYELHLFERERIAVLNIPHSEICHRFSRADWEKLLDFVEDNFGSREELIAQYRKFVAANRLKTIALFVGLVLVLVLVVLYSIYTY